MKAAFPSPAESIVEGMRSPISRSWSQWMRDFWASCGFSPSVQQHADMTLGGPELDMAGGFTWSTHVGNIMLPEIPPAVDSGCMGVFRLPNNYREGTALQPWLEWAPVDAAAGDVDWRWEYIVARAETAPAAATDSLDETSTAPEVAGQPVRVEFDEIDEDCRKGDSVLVRLWRLGTGDTYGNGAHLIACGLKYVIDGAGTEAVHP